MLPLVLALVSMMGLGAGCATLGGEAEGARRARPAGDDDGWQALADGRNADAAARFDAALAADPGDAVALFGAASLAFERGDNVRSLRSYVALVERAAVAPDPSASLFAPVAIGRVATLLDEDGGPSAARRAVEDRVLAILPARLPWEARHGLALLADRIARRRGDPDLLARVARAAGCVRDFVVEREAGILPHLDLDEPAETPKGQPVGRSVSARGCVVAVPAFDDQPGAQRVVADIQAAGGGLYDVVLDFQGEGRLIVDGGAPVRHGDEYRYGPRVTATRVRLRPGRHRLELRLSTFGGHPNLALLVVPASAEGDERAVGDARVLGAVADPIAPNPAARASASPSVLDGLDAAADAGDHADAYAAAYVANHRGDMRGAWIGLARLTARPRFAIGWALAASIARDDPSRPSSFDRDQARTLLLAASGIDPSLARVRHTLAGIALDDDRPREALDQALGAARAAPAWWPPQLMLSATYRLRGLDWDSDRALDRAIALAPEACSVVQAALVRADDRRDTKAEAGLIASLGVCGRDSDEQLDRLRRRGDLAGAEAALRRAVALAPDRDDAKWDLASVLIGRGKAREAAALLSATADKRDGDGQIRLANALIVAGDRDKAKQVIAAALGAHPDLPEIVKAARALGLALPLDPYRIDGRQVIHAFESSGRHYAAPAVVVLDRTVTRVFPSGAEMVLTHEIVRVQSKEAIEKWGESAIPDHTEILVLRTHKADGTTREPEELAGKDTISAADLAIGDYVEKETLEVRPPRDAFVSSAAAAGVTAHATQAKGATAGTGTTVATNSEEPQAGFIGDRFYFQSFDAPLDRSEYLLVTSATAAGSLSVDRRAGAPEATRAPGLDDGAGGAPTVVTTFATAQVPQLFAEPSSVPAIEHVPSVRVSIAVGWAAWARFLREQLYGTLRTSPAIERAADAISAHVPAANPRARAAAVVAWVGQNVEADDDLRDPASFAVVRGRGNRLAVILTLARLLGLDARPVLARSRLTADGAAPAPIQEADDFADPLVRFSFPGYGIAYVDPRLKHAPLGYLPPGLDGARAVVLASAARPDVTEFEIARSRSDDHRAVNMDIRLDGQGGGVAEADEALRGWPALEWAEIMDRFGRDPTKLRQDFEQRWLGVHFPGAVLKDLDVEIVAPGGGGDSHDGNSDGGHAGNSDGNSDWLAAGGGRGVATGARPISVVPKVPYAAVEVRLRYSFTSSRLALRRDREIRFLPTFFRSQPGRRYATEPHRLTTLMTGFDVPLDLNARVELPPAARFVETPPIAAADAIIARPGGYRFVEDRRIEQRTNAAPVLILKRQARFPIMRVPLQEYPSIAADLRRVDAREQEEIRIGIGPERPGATP